MTAVDCTTASVSGKDWDLKSMGYNFASFIAGCFADSTLPYCFPVNMEHESSLGTIMCWKTMVRSLSYSSFAKRAVPYLENFTGLSLLNT